MNMNLEKLQDAIERAVQALEGLEQALDASDNRRVGARLYELHRALKEASDEAQLPIERKPT